MKYFDLHCDTLTVCADRGLSLSDRGLQASVEKLKNGGCALQCFAVFTEGASAPSDFKRYLSFYEAQLKACDKILPVRDYADVERARKEDRLAAVLTVENLGFTNGNPDELPLLRQKGVKMASLVWNTPNAYASPNIIFRNGLPRFEKRNKEGLTPLGKQAVERLNELKIIIDISHLSDGGADYVLENSRLPVVASHSNAWEVCGVSRNLTDAQIKKIADCGGVAGVNYCRDFLGGGEPFESVYKHIKHMINVGGEDVVALGSDFDGIPAYDELCDCSRVPNLLEYLVKRGISPRQLQKLCFENVKRTFKDSW